MGHNTSHSQRRHLLYIAFWYPPSRASGVYRALGTTSAFVEAGWDVTVITCNREFLEDEVGSVDSSLEAQIPRGVHIERVPFTFWESSGRDLRSVGWLAGNFPHLSRLRERNEVPDKYAAWISPAVERATETASAKEFDHILATGNPFSAFEAARLIADRLDVGFSVDFRDPWTIDVFSGSRVANAEVREAESKIVRQALACFHVNEPIASAYAELYPDQAAKQIVAPNGYDPASLGTARPAAPYGPFRFGTLGTVTERWPLDALFDGWATARDNLPEGSEFVIAGHLGYFEHSSEQLLARLSDEHGIRYVGPVEKSKVGEFYRSLDVVVVPVPGGPLVTSGKIYEAMALGIPLVCVQQEGGGARELISDHPAAVAAEPRSASVTAAFLEAAATARSLTPQDADELRKKMSRYERSHALGVIAETIERAL